MVIRIIRHTADRYSLHKDLDVEPSGEPPILADLVAGGELPPLAERLPEHPVVMEGVDGIGRYPLFLEALTQAADLCDTPAHDLRPYHPDPAIGDVQKIAKAMRDNWEAVFKNNRGLRRASRCLSVGLNILAPRDVNDLQRVLCLSPRSFRRAMPASFLKCWRLL